MGKISVGQTFPVCSRSLARQSHGSDLGDDLPGWPWLNFHPALARTSHRFPWFHLEFHRNCTFICLSYPPTPGASQHRCAKIYFYGVSRRYFGSGGENTNMTSFFLEWIRPEANCLLKVLELISNLTKASIAIDISDNCPLPGGLPIQKDSLSTLEWRSNTDIKIFDGHDRQELAVR